MAASEKTPFLITRASEQVPVVTGNASRRWPSPLTAAEPPTFELESYIDNYKGRTRLIRLLFIGTTSEVIGREALRLAIPEAKHGTDTQLYLRLVDALRDAAPEDPLARRDDAWVQQKEAHVRAQLHRMRMEMRTYESNLIRESLRVSNAFNTWLPASTVKLITELKLAKMMVQFASQELGSFHYGCGDLSTAHHMYKQAQSHSTAPEHNAGLNVVLLALGIERRSWSMVQTMVNGLEANSSVPYTADDRARLAMLAPPCLGIAHLGQQQYHAAAEAFLSTSPEYLTSELVEASERGGVVGFREEVMTGSDIAIYGTLCALASMDRVQLKKRVLENTAFRSFFELEPHLRRAVDLFCKTKYRACLDVLERYRPDYMLDIHLSRLVGDMYGEIRSRSIVAFLVPFSRVTLAEMARMFWPAEVTAGGGPTQTLVEELEEMIDAGILDARLDLVEDTLVRPATNERHKAYAEAAEQAETTNNGLRLYLHHVDMLYGGIEIQERDPPDGGAGSGAANRGGGSGLFRGRGFGPRPGDM